MKSLEELIELKEPALPLLMEWISSATNHCELLPPSVARGEVLQDTQVTTRSPMGAVAYETGGILVDHGWLRFLGSGHPKLSRTLPGWNQNRASGYYLVADDAVGGFFAVNGGAFGEDMGSVYYWPPDSLEWEPMNLGYSALLRWALAGDLARFYSNVRWATWNQDVATLSGDRCFNFYPPLWTKEGGLKTSLRAALSTEEAFGAKVDMLSQIAGFQAPG